MQNKLLNTCVAGIVLFLTGCQSTSVNNVFAPLPSFSSSNSMTLAQAAQDALSRSPDPMIAQVHVTTNQNTVILSGYVKKIRQSDTAEQIVREVQGVQHIENHIIVRP